MKNYSVNSKSHWFYKRLRSWRIPSRIAFIVVGLLSTIWFLIRVIPKPSRATYPCIRTTAPFMSAFVIYLLSISASVFAFRRFRARIISSRYISAVGFFIVAVFSVFISGMVNNRSANAIQLVEKSSFTANDPMGIAKGIHPGRVVWVWDPDATDETCTNTSGDYWFDNTDGGVVENMLSYGIMSLAGESTLSDAWDALFRHFNSNHEKGDVGYTAGEKIFVKINITNSCCSVNDSYVKTTDFERMDATPELALALLKQLIEVVGVEQSDIYFGDPFRKFQNLYWNTCHPVYPDVNYCDGHGNLDRYKITPTSEDLMKFSDGKLDYRIPQEYVDAAYFINMPCLKSHDSGGITLSAKNHQGSILQDGAIPKDQYAIDMHYALPDHDASEGGSHRYRHLVDYIGHEHLGGKTVLAIIDGIWAGKSWEGWVEKWQMTPFNNDYPSSLILSQDLVAIESVGFDFLLEEYENKDASEQYPYMAGTADYIFQAADPANWPEGISYDPEGDGTLLGSLGVYEHWNNATDKQYSRNLGTGDGIELVQELQPQYNTIKQNKQVFTGNVHSYPNPASDQIFLEYYLSSPGITSIDVFSINGMKIENLRTQDEFIGSQQLVWNVNHLTPGSYIFRITHKNINGQLSVTSKKFMVK